jgi:hypothetical protein
VHSSIVYLPDTIITTVTDADPVATDLREGNRRSADIVATITHRDHTGDVRASTSVRKKERSISITEVASSEVSTLKTTQVRKALHMEAVDGHMP